MVDPRQILAGFLTFTMFAMLAHMIKREHFDSVAEVKTPQSPDAHFKNTKLAGSISFPREGPWKEDDSELKPCWVKPNVEEAGQSEGFVYSLLLTVLNTISPRLLMLWLWLEVLELLLYFLTLGEADWETEGTSKMFMMLRNL
ncbi:hypothetical protein Nepgr_019392 [Nepenthes gracilis]|uniref:Uncharacterized protein n=1 Tax=Nepenthes gracilis TaxID=150966 RepID=A0AAD3XV98_NEPGR|nr:hypothetical protein Nepgr_019392 [Nepenthes gracilis]